MLDPEQSGVSRGAATRSDGTSVESRPVSSTGAKALVWHHDRCSPSRAQGALPSVRSLRRERRRGADSAAGPRSQLATTERHPRGSPRTGSHPRVEAGDRVEAHRMGGTDELQASPKRDRRPASLLASAAKQHCHRRYRVPCEATVGARLDQACRGRPGPRVLRARDQWATARGVTASGSPATGIVESVMEDMTTTQPICTFWPAARRITPCRWPLLKVCGVA
jgi:hypothetical protein